MLIPTIHSVHRQPSGNPLHCIPDPVTLLPCLHLFRWLSIVLDHPSPRSNLEGLHELGLDPVVYLASYCSSPHSVPDTLASFSILETLRCILPQDFCISQSLCLETSSLTYLFVLPIFFKSLLKCHLLRLSGIPHLKYVSFPHPFS